MTSNEHAEPSDITAHSDIAGLRVEVMSVDDRENGSAIRLRLHADSMLDKAIDSLPIVLRHEAQEGQFTAYFSIAETAIAQDK